MSIQQRNGKASCANEFGFVGSPIMANIVNRFGQAIRTMTSPREWKAYKTAQRLARKMAQPQNSSAPVNHHDGMVAG